MCIRLCVTNSKKIFFWQITLQKTQKTLNRQHHRNGIRFSLFSHEILWMKKCPRWKISNIFESKLWNQILLSLHLTTHKNFWQSFLDFYILSVFDLVLQTLCEFKKYSTTLINFMEILCSRKILSFSQCVKIGGK